MEKVKDCPLCGRSIRACNFERHYQACVKNNGQPKIIGKYKLTHEGLICIYCNKECKNRNSLCNHERLCSKNPNRQSPIHSGFNDVGHIPWNKGLTSATDDRVAKIAEVQSIKYKGKPGKPCSEEAKEKLRLYTINALKILKGSLKVRYNKNACLYIEQLNKKNNWNLQHAENGGEFCIGGYFLDGYDKDLNIAFEYDEPSHYKNIKKNILKDKDINRMNYIISKLNCEFYRYNEKLDLFYRSN